MTHSRIHLTILSATLVAGSLGAQEVRFRAEAEAARSHVMGMRRSLGLDTDHGFAPLRSHRDYAGQVHTRLQQTYKGVKVWGGEIIAHADGAGSQHPLTTAVRPSILLDVNPSLGVSEALAIANRDLNGKAEYTLAPKVELVIFPQLTRATPAAMETSKGMADGSMIAPTYKLAYYVHTEIESPEQTAHVDYMVDAHTGEVIQKWNSLRTGNAVGTANTQYSGTVSVNTNLNGSSFELNDISRGMNIKIYNLNHATSGTGTLYTDADNTWGDGQNYPTGTGTSTTGATGQTTAVDAMYALQSTYDILKNMFGHNGIDGNDRATYARVHYSTSYDNAFWSDSCFCMTFGDGQYFKSLTAPDIVAHEMAHGVCSNTADLTYSGESGGLNEANSDIIGNMAELYMHNAKSLPATVANTNAAWLVGEQITTPSYPGPLRYMYKPSLDGSSPDAWSSSLKDLDVHYSSGPGNRMFFFLSQGASSTSSSNYYSSYAPNGFPGIGPEKAVKIWFRALSTYMTSSTDYAGARTACLSAAADLHGASSAEYLAVMNAFGAINVGDLAPDGVVVALTPEAVTLAPSASYQFTASVTNAANTGVTWSCSAGSVNATGLYSAPADLGTYTVTATSVQDPTRSKSATVTVWADVVQPGDVLVNGSFEGDATGWTGTTTTIGTWPTQPAYSGSKNAFFGGKGKTTTQEMYQAVTIPANATSATLSFQLHVDTAETTTTKVYDKLVVAVRDSSGATTLQTLATYSNLDKAAGYALKSFDLSAYKGQTVQIYFQCMEDISLQTSFVVDAASLVAPIPAVAPVISSHPVNASVFAGAKANFSVVATGDPAPNYLWQKSSDNGTTWKDCIIGTGMTTADYTTAKLAASADGWQYRVKVSNTGGTVYSEVATLTVWPCTPPTIATQPTDQTAQVGKKATFSVVANGDPVPSFTWQKSDNNGRTWKDCIIGTGMTTATYTTAKLATSANGWKYRVKVSNPGATLYSNVVTLTVTP